MKRLTPFLFLILFLTLFVACDVTDNANKGTGRFAVKLTDAPAEYDAIYIEVEAVKVKANSDEVAEEGNKEGWITISDDTTRVDLLQLQNGETILLGEEELEAGFYHQIRLILGDDNVIEINGITYPLTTPSAQQSGLKLNIDAEVGADEVYVLLIDFNAAKSIVETGSGKFILKPVIRTVSLGETGSIAGIVEPATFQTTVLAIADGDTLTTFTEDSGEFKFIGVLPNTYDFVFKPGNEAFADTTIADIAVETDEEVDLGTVTLQEK